MSWLGGDFVGSRVAIVDSTPQSLPLEANAMQALTILQQARPKELFSGPSIAILVSVGKRLFRRAQNE